MARHRVVAPDEADDLITGYLALLDPRRTALDRRLSEPLLPHRLLDPRFLNGGTAMTDLSSRTRRLPPPA